MNLLHRRHLQLDPEADGLVKEDLEQPAFSGYIFRYRTGLKLYQTTFAIIFVQCIWK